LQPSGGNLELQHTLQNDEEDREGSCLCKKKPLERERELEFITGRIIQQQTNWKKTHETFGSQTQLQIITSGFACKQMGVNVTDQAWDEFAKELAFSCNVDLSKIW
jgi:hypothetical protein